MSQKIKKRIIHGISANGIGQMVTIAIQLLGVPVFLHSWGKDVYGEWLLLTALPTYITMSDFGIRNVAGNEMTMMYAKGDSEKVLDVFQSAWVVTSIISLAILAIILSTAWFIPFTTMLNISCIPQQEISLVLILFAVQVVVTMQTDLLSVGYRCTGNYARGVLISNMVRFVEFFLMLGVVWYGAGPFGAAATFLAAGVVGRLVVRIDIKRICPWLQYGFEHSHIAHAKRLFRPGIASMGLSLSSIFANQGIITVLGITLGPSSVVLFSTMRTLTRFAFQTVNMINTAILPEMSLALGADDKILSTRIHNYACRLSFWLNILMIVFLLIFGRHIFEIWTNHAIQYDTALCMIFMLSMLLNAMWTTSSVVLVATNNIFEMSAYYLASNVAAIVLAYIAGLFFNVNVIVLPLLVVEIVMIMVVVPRTLNIVNVKVKDYIISNLNLMALFAKR